jgi:hypothetical protein
MTGFQNNQVTTSDYPSNITSKCGGGDFISVRGFGFPLKNREFRTLTINYAETENGELVDKIHTCEVMPDEEVIEVQFRELSKLVGAECAWAYFRSLNRFFKSMAKIKKG